MPLPTRSAKRAATTHSSVGASGKIELGEGGEAVARRTTSGLRRRKKSDSTPENTLTIIAVASAMPSTIPIVSVEAPSPIAMYSGSSA